MPRRPANLTQADVARVIRAAKQAGASSVEIRVGNQVIAVKLSSTAIEAALAPDEDVVL